MEYLLNLLKDKNYQKRKVALIENGTWAPSAAKTMREIISGMKDVEIMEPVVTIKTTMNEKNVEELNVLAEELLK